MCVSLLLTSKGVEVVTVYYIAPDLYFSISRLRHCVSMKCLIKFILFFFVTGDRAWFGKLVDFMNPWVQSCTQTYDYSRLAPYCIFTFLHVMNVNQTSPYRFFHAAFLKRISCPTYHCRLPSILVTVSLLAAHPVHHLKILQVRGWGK